jgi:hypothetical protein
MAPEPFPVEQSLSIPQASPRERQRLDEDPFITKSILSTQGIKMSIGDVWYETSPYFYASLGAVVMLGSYGTLATSSGGLLVIAAMTILRMRWVYRRNT